MPVALKISRVDTTGSGSLVEGTFALTGNYPAGGDTLDWTQSGGAIPSNTSPLGLVDVKEQPLSGQVPSGYLAYLIAGTGMNNWLLYLTTAGGQPPTQLPAGAYPAGLTAATFQFRAYFPYGY